MGEPHSAMLAASMEAAVDALHGGDPSRAVEANRFLVELVDQPAAAGAADMLLSIGTASAASLTFAAGLVGRAAEHSGGAAVQQHLLNHCARLACKPACTRLAQALVTVAVAETAEDALLTSQAVAGLEPPRQLIILHVLAERMEQQASPEELHARPSAVAASARALELLMSHLLHPPSTPPAVRADPASIMRCLASWAACGLGYAAFYTTHKQLLAALLQALVALPRLPTCQVGRSGHGYLHERASAEQLSEAALVAEVLRCCLQSSLELDVCR